MRGTPEIQAGMSPDAVYVPTPPLCQANTSGVLFVVDADERGAKKIDVEFGQVVGNYVEVRRGLKPGDRVIVNDMSQYEVYPAIKLN